MKVKKLFENWGMTGLKLNVGFLETEWTPQVKECEAAWDLYIELLTRIATQPLPDNAGVEKSALDSVYSLFPVTRGILKQYGRDSITFAKIAIVILNQVVRPFTAKWHKLSSEGALEEDENKVVFRADLNQLQNELQKYMGILSEIAGVEEISNITNLSN